MHSSPKSSLERTRERRRIIIDNTRAVRDCRVVVITPGLIESWWDSEAGYYLNQAPPIKYLKKYPSRFRLHVLSYEEVVRVYDDIYELLRRHLVEDFKIVFTVSPVPLHFTFREMDVIVANAYSKSVLRAAAEQFCLKHDNVDYFPSFESFGCSNRQIAWEEDLVHPTDIAVGVNVQRMIDSYMNTELAEYDRNQLTSSFEARLFKSLGRANEEIESLRQQLEAIDPKKIERMELLRKSQEELIEALRAQLKRSQDTTTYYLKQVMEKDAALRQAAGD